MVGSDPKIEYDEYRAGGRVLVLGWGPIIVAVMQVWQGD